MLGTCLISWKPKKQQVVSRSSAEAEYRSMANATAEIQFIKYLLADLGEPQGKSAYLYGDNQSALHIAKNSIFHERTKHIELDCHFVREKVDSNELILKYVKTNEQVEENSLIYLSS